MRLPHGRAAASPRNRVLGYRRGGNEGWGKVGEDGSIPRQYGALTQHLVFVGGALCPDSF
jgi:hypothetical protein